MAFGHGRTLCFAVAIVGALGTRSVLAQGGYDDDRVMMQGFMWESHQSGTNRAHGVTYTVDWEENWYEHVREKLGALADSEFDLIWLPPPSEGEGAGYHPRQYHEFDNNYGSLDEHRDLIHDLLGHGIEPIADVVVNHRNGTDGWSTFKNPDWPQKFICSTDEFWRQPVANPTLSPADVKVLADANSGLPVKGGEDFKGSNFWDWDGARDLDHENGDLRKGVKEYLKRLRAFGYRGWRYDMVKGFKPGYVAEYNFDSSPTFAVGEYLDRRSDLLTNWVDGTKMAGQPDPAEKACPAFDFATQERLRDVIKAGEYPKLADLVDHDGSEDGLIAINANKAVTFVENHDTGWPQKQFDSLPNDEKVLQAYAFILTHPGIPCVYWKHFFEWGHGGPIKALIKARKYAGVHSGSFLKTEIHGDNYVAIVGDRPTESSTLIVKIGPGTGFRPDESVWGQETFGNGYSVWVRKAKKAETQAAVDAAKSPLPLP